MSACDTCAHDGGDPGNVMAYVHCLYLDEIIQRPSECEHYVDADTVCPKCGTPMVCDTMQDFLHGDGVQWRCPNPGCRHLEDVVYYEDQAQEADEHEAPQSK